MPSSRTERKLAKIMDKLAATDDVQLELMQKVIDEAILLSMSEMKDIVADHEHKPEVRVQAANNIVSTGNYLTKRRALTTGKKVTIMIGDNMKIKGASTEIDERAAHALLGEEDAEE